jgi:predicted phage tail protein
MLGSMRALAVLAFAAAAVLVGVGHSSGHRFLVAMGAALFLLGVAAFFRWRAKVLASEDKTSPKEGG